MRKYKPTIGMEVHVELKTKTKMFCDCRNNPDEKKPNTDICPICLAHPGTLPTINEDAVKKVLKVGLALECNIAKYSYFDRKNYFYPDLPKGYQITQYKDPLCGPGKLNINGRDIGITRIHLEEDTGKLSHPKGTDDSLVDFNRAGRPLMELVSEPDIKTGKEAKAFCEELRLMLRYLKVSLANMEKGEMRCEVNISISDTEKFGTKVEIKNLNSFKAVERSVNYEIERQTKLLNKGEEIIQETRGWDESKEKTVSQRKKEESHDYRYFPEPDLPPFDIIHDDDPDDLKRIQEGGIYLSDIKRTMPELPNAKRERLAEEYSLPKDQVEVLVKNKDLGEYFEKVASELQEWVKVEEQKEKVDTPDKKKLYKLAANYLVTELQKLTKKSEDESIIEKITAENFAELVKMIYESEINSSAAQKILKIMFKTAGDPSDIAESEGLIQMSDSSELEGIVEKIIDNNPDVVKDYNSGQANAVQFLIGQAMKETKGQANPQMVQKILFEKLKD